MNLEIKNVLSIELGEVLSNEKSDYSHRTLVITTSDGQVTVKLYTKGDEECLKIVL
jgi:hypothetical protein